MKKLILLGLLASIAGAQTGGVSIVIGNVASGATDGGNPVKVGGVFNTTPPTLTNGQRGDVQLDSSGNIKVNVAAGGASGGTSSSFGAAFPATGTAAGYSDGTNMQGARVVDADTGAGTVYVLLNNLVRRASGGPIELIGSATGANSIPVVIASDQGAFPVIDKAFSCGTTAAIVDWAAITNVSTAPSGFTATTCLSALGFTNITGANHTITVTDGAGTPVTIINAMPIAGNTTIIVPMYGMRANTGIKWAADANSAITASATGWQ